MLVDAGLSLPNGVLIDDRFRGMSSEQIYNLLESESKTETEQDFGKEGGDDEPGGEESKDETSPGGDSNDPSVPVTEGGIRQVLDAPPPNEGTPTIEEHAREWDVAVNQATSCPAGGQGSGRPQPDPGRGGRDFGRLAGDAAAALVGYDSG